MSGELWLNNDHSVLLEGDGKLTDSLGNPVEGAAVSITLLDVATDAEVSGVSWPITLTDLGGGVYKGQLPRDVDVMFGTPYTLVVTAIAGGAKGEWRSTVVAKYRDFSD